MHTCGYITFLVLVFMASLRGGSGNPWLDMACHGFAKTLPDSAAFILILVWVIGEVSFEHITSAAVFMFGGCG